MKHVLSVFIAAVCLLFGLLSLAGCATTSSSNESVSTESSSQAFNYEGAIEKTTLVDNEVLTVTADSLNYENNQAILSLTITNNTSGELSISASTLAYPANFINGYMVPDGWFSEDLPSAETVTTEAKYSLDELRMYGIKGINETGLGIYATDENYDTVYQDVSTIKTSLGDNYSDSIFKEAINDPSILGMLNATVKNTTTNLEALTYNGLHFNTAILATNEEGDNALLLEVENAVDIPMVMRCSNLKINGQLVYEYAINSAYLEPGKKRVSTNDLTYYLEEADLLDMNDSISEVSFTYDLVDEKYNILAGETEVTITF